MSGIVNKVKAKVDDVLHKDSHNTTTGTHTGTTGTHNTTGTHSTTGGLTGSSHTHNDPTGPHSSHAANKADPRVDSDHYGAAGNTAGAGGVGAGQYGSSTHTGTHGTTGGLTGSSHAHGNDPTGPHSSHLANKADPRVDSDRYGTAGNTSGAGGVGAGQYGSSHTGTHGTTGGLTGGNHNTTHGSAGGLGQSHATSHGDPSGPHSSSLANKLDPTVDTKSYGTANPATGHYGSGNTHGTTGGLTGGSHNTHGTTGYSDPTGPHDSRLANKADPRVDSDRYGAAGNTSGAGGYGAGQYGSNTGSGLTGSHGTHTGTTGSGLTGSHGTHGTTGHSGTVGSGNSNTTAGPHNSDLLNKVDPRVDSDLDGSKTYGGNQTYH